MKRYIAFLLAIITILSLASCRKIEKEPDETTGAEISTTEPETTMAEETTAEEETTAPETTAEETTEAITEPIVEINEETAVHIAKEYLGERDPDTGYLYSYQYVETTAEGDFKIKVSWYLEEDERYSTCGYLLVSEEGMVTKFDW